MGIKHEVRLKVSANAASPAVCGLFRPVILVPANLGRKLGSRDLRAVLLHELAHIKRGDLWVNLAQTVLQIAYFYNPLLWLASAMIRRVREQAVDEMVLVAMGRKAKSYPETLVNVAKLAFKQPTLSLRLIGVVESKNALAGRIKRILTRPLPKSAKLGILGLIVIIVAACVLLPMAKAEKPSTEDPGIGIDDESGWSEPVDGLRAGLTRSTATITVGEPVIVEMFLNRSGRWQGTPRLCEA
jgi:beta-lactamase regulating signal transducer with metallopeptidase domain